MKFNINNNMISRGALSGAVVLVAVAAFIGISNGGFSEFGIYACLALFLLNVLVHVFFRDKNFDKLQAINTMVWMLLPWLAILSLYAFSLGAYVAMFISVGFFFLLYLIHLLQGVLELKEEKTV